MRDDVRDLFLSGDGISGIRLRGDDANAVESLRRFADLVHSNLQDPAGDADAHLCSTEPAPEIAERFHLHQDRRTLSYFRGYQRGFYLYARDDGSRRYVMAKLQKLLLYGYAASLINGGDFDLIHGALLETAPGTGTLLFGVSGIGKSTTVRRWRAAGNTAIADDMVYLYCRNGEFYARPLPTWSACIAGENPDCYDFNRKVRVERALLLLRDEKRTYRGNPSNPLPARCGQGGFGNIIVAVALSAGLLAGCPRFAADGFFRETDQKIPTARAFGAFGGKYRGNDGKVKSANRNRGDDFLTISAQNAIL